MKKTSPKTTAETEGQLIYVDPSRLEVEPGFNVRGEDSYTEDELKALAMSISSLGLLSPIVGYAKNGNPKKDKIVITDGHRRHFAIKHIPTFHKNKEKGFHSLDKIKLVPVRLGTKDHEERLLVMMTSGESIKRYAPHEQLDLFTRYIEYQEKKGVPRGEAIEQIIEKGGVSRAHVYKILQIEELAKPVQEAIAKDKISGDTALAIGRKVAFDPKETTKLVKQAIKSAETKAKEKGQSVRKARATNADAKGIIQLTPWDRLQEVVDKLHVEGLEETKFGKLFVSVVNKVTSKEPIGEIVKLFADKK